MKNKELRVAIFTGNYNHIADGVSLTLNRLVAYLMKHDIPVMIFGPTTDKPAIDHKGEFVPVPSLPLPGRPEYRVTVGFPEEVQQRLREFSPTLVHIATPDLLGFRAMRFAQANDIQIVASYHTHFTSYLSYYNMDMLEMLGWKYLNWFYEQCKHIYVPTASMADELHAHGITHGLRIWSRGVDSDQFCPEKRDMEWRRSHGIDDNNILVSFVSRLVWEKDLQTVVDSMKRVFEKDRNVKALIVGDGPARKEMEHMLKGAIFTGFLRGDDLAGAYASSDVFFYPSDTETFGNVTLEAMASGLPSVVADATGSRSLVESGVNGLVVPPKKTKEFASAILKLARDDELRCKMAETARQKSLAYSWDNIMSDLVQNYMEALAEPRPELKI